MEEIGALGMKHLTNNLYREDDLNKRTKLVFKWVKQYELTQVQFDELISYCTEKQIASDKCRRYGSNLKIYQTNGGLGHRQLAYIIRLGKSELGYDYLIIGGQNVSHLDGYEPGSLMEDLEDIYLEETTYKLEDSPLYKNVLFKQFIKKYSV